MEGHSVMPEKPSKHVVRLRAACDDAASGDAVTRLTSFTLAAAAGLAIATPVYQVDATVAFHIGIDCALGAMVLYALNRVLRILRGVAEMLDYNYRHFNGRLDGVDDMEGKTADGVNGVLRIFERSRGDGTGPQHIRRIGR